MFKEGMGSGQHVLAVQWSMCGGRGPVTMGTYLIIVLSQSNYNSNFIINIPDWLLIQRFEICFKFNKSPVYFNSSGICPHFCFDNIDI